MKSRKDIATTFTYKLTHTRLYNHPTNRSYHLPTMSFLNRPRVRLQRLPLRLAFIQRPSSTFAPGAPSPAPPRLPPAEQAEFERLQRSAAAQILGEPAVGAKPDILATPAGSKVDTIANIPTRMPAPEFEGDKNPRTGEVNGPKSEPLRWGSKGDWSYNGRVTDF
jgi:hypothetical protein